MIESIVMWFVAYSAYIMPETEKKKTHSIDKNLIKV